MFLLPILLAGILAYVLVICVCFISHLYCYTCSTGLGFMAFSIFSYSFFIYSICSKELRVYWLIGIVFPWWRFASFCLCKFCFALGGLNRYFCIRHYTHHCQHPLYELSVFEVNLVTGVPTLMLNMHLHALNRHCVESVLSQ